LLTSIEWTLGRLAAAAGYELTAGERLPVTGVQENSRLCEAGDLFVAIPGSRQDGLRYVDDARARGAIAVAAERDPGGGIPWLKVGRARRAAARLADLIYGDPSRHLALVGVTGTNGKTTTAHLLAQLLPGPVGTIGTLGASYPGAREATENTTPGPSALRRYLREMVRSGCGGCIMEVSSHGLDQGRVAELRFAAAVYTNLSGDHLDYHGSMEAYASAKASLFEGLDSAAFAVLNGADPACARIRTRAQVVHFAADEVAPDALGTRFRWRGRQVRVPLVGRHNAENSAAALEAACALGADPDECVAALAGVLPVRGRLQPVQTRPFLVLVDYAHTDDGLEKVLRAAREVTPGRLHAVFGCGGDRDRSKRPRMGAAAARWADRVIVTNDNPRSEEPERIAAEVVSGMGTRRPDVHLDRRAAIFEAISAARPGDTVLIAGKGHETYQIVGEARLPFDDADVARQAIDSVRP
jgi:UDP-N-acetylmuramoyl-L-alanyl-D-glutamate--2,6-diaminopimelate ligase